MLNNTSHQRNATQNHNEIPLYTTQFAITKKVLRGYGIKGPLDNYWDNRYRKIMEIPQKTKNSPSIQQFYFCFYLKKKTHTHLH